MTGRGVHRSSTVVMSFLMVLIGLALVVQTIGGHHGGVLSARLLIGALFVVAGLGRLYVETRRGRRT